MIHRTFSVVLAFAGLSLLFRDAMPQPAPRSIFVRVFAATASRTMGDMDGYLVDNVSSWAGPGASIAGTGGFGPTFLVGGEAGYMLSPLWSLGICVTRSWNDDVVLFGNFISDAGNDALDASMTDVTATATLWAPGGLFAGGEAGVGFGELKETFEYRSAYPGGLNYHGDWENAGFVGGAFAGYQYGFSIGLAAVGKAGYKYRNLGTMAGSTTTTESAYSSNPPGVTPGPITDSTGRALESDFSCFYFTLGLGWRFGGRR
jgi:hypothetical protein